MVKCHENLFSITSSEGNAIWNCNEISPHRCCNCWLMIPIQYSYTYFLCLFQCVYVCGRRSQRGRERQTKREKDYMFTGHRTSLPSTFSTQGLTLSESHWLGWTEYSVSLSCAETTMGQPMPPFFWGFFWLKLGSLFLRVKHYPLIYLPGP